MLILCVLLGILSRTSADILRNSDVDTQNSSHLWRIIPHYHLDAVTLSTKNQFEVEYLGNSIQIKWFTSEACHIQDDSARQTAVSCTKPGFHPITVAAQQNCEYNCNFTKIVKVEENLFCYQWYLKMNKNSSLADVAELQVWIINTQNAADDEMRGSAQQPSQDSKLISKLFHLKQQEPTLKIFNEQTEEAVDVPVTFFNQNSSCWEINMKIPDSHWTYITISGFSHVSHNSCFIRDTNWIIERHRFDNELEGENTLITDPVQNPKLIASTCSPHLAVVMTNGNIFLTQDGFLSVQNITVNIPLGTNIVSSVAFSSHSLWILMNDGKIINLNNTMATQAFDLENIIGMAIKQSCTDSPLYGDDENVAAWTNQTMFVKMNTETEFQEVQPTAASNLNLNTTMTIICASFTFGQDKLLIMLSNTLNTTTVFVLYNLDNNSWEYLPIAIHGKFTGKVELMVLASSDISFIFWDTFNVYYSYEIGKSNGMMELRLQSGSIQQLSVSRHGDILLLTDTNQLYYSQTYSNNFLQLSPYQLADISTSLYFDVLSRVYIITVCDGIVLRQSYPLFSEVESALSQNINTFIRYEQSINPEIVYLDIGDEIDLHVNIIHSTTEADDIQVKVSHSHLATVNIQDEVTFFPGKRGISKTVKVAVNKDFANVYNKSDVQGIMVIEARPQSTELKPYRPLRMVSQISVGCPPGRHIRVEKPLTCAPIELQYTIPQSAIQDGQGDTIVNYDFETFGCPIDSNHQQLFRPTIRLYDRDEYVEVVPANFILWELQQRTDYTYNTTTKESHITCFADACDNIPNLSEPYSIMNNSGSSFVSWQNQQDAIFQFTALVVDADYSFCVLKDSFAVKVEYIGSVDISNSVMEMILGLFTSISLTIAAVSYVYFRKAHIATLNIKHMLTNRDGPQMNIKEWSNDDKTTRASHA